MKTVTSRTVKICKKVKQLCPGSNISLIWTSRGVGVENLEELENEADNLTVQLYLEIHDPNTRKRQIGRVDCRRGCNDRSNSIWKVSPISAVRAKYI